MGRRRERREVVKRPATMSYLNCQTLKRVGCYKQTTVGPRGRETKRNMTNHH